MVRRPIDVGLGAVVCLCASSSAFAIPLFDTGPPRPLSFDSTNMGNYDPDGDGMNNLTFLGLSSGNLSAGSPQRWMAQPFSLPAGTWTITQIDTNYFIPAGGEFSMLSYRIWNRLPGNPAPVAGDLLALGSVAAPVGLDDPEIDADGSGDPLDGDDDWLHQIFPVGLVLGGGDYYLTIYGDGDGAPADNAAWLTNADNGINLLDGAGLPRGWRSAAFPVPGFVNYQLPATTILQQAGLDPNDVYNTAFTIYGEIPGPGTVAVLGLGLLGYRRRRR